MPLSMLRFRIDQALDAQKDCGVQPDLAQPRGSGIISTLGALQHHSAWRP